MKPFFDETTFNYLFGGTMTRDAILCLVERANRQVENVLHKRGTVVYAEKSHLGGYHIWKEPEQKHQFHTHTALLINIEPVVKDSAEKIVEDLARECWVGPLGPTLTQLIDRAKKLKEQK